MKLGEIAPNVALRGSIMRVTESSDPQGCQTACRAESRCVAWTYTVPKPGETAGRCSLKAVIPQSFADPCCTSGVERVPEPQLRVPPEIPSGITGALAGVELEGGTYRYFGDATIESCQSACRADSQCIAWDYSRPGIFSSDARCFLKNRPSMQSQSACCVAGFEQRQATTPAPPNTAAAPPAAASTGNGVLSDTNFVGADYRNFVLPSDDWSRCQSACKADSQCLAWTSVHPGVQGSSPRCWLKDKIPRAVPNTCCTSGIERSKPD
jgi:hypothetical protein